MRRREILAGAVTLPGVLAQQANWKPLTLNANQNETVITLTDLLIPATDTPGAKAVNVNRYIDLLLTDGPARQRTMFLAGLAKLDALTQQSHGKPFRNCTAVQQTAILKQSFDGTVSEDIAEFLSAAKAMTSRIYYNTEIGEQELNKGGRVPKSFACKA
jgi:hypothetical protein